MADPSASDPGPGSAAAPPPKPPGRPDACLVQCQGVTVFNSSMKAAGVEPRCVGLRRVTEAQVFWSKDIVNSRGTATTSAAALEKAAAVEQAASRNNELDEAEASAAAAGGGKKARPKKNPGFTYACVGASVATGKMTKSGQLPLCNMGMRLVHLFDEDEAKAKAKAGAAAGAGMAHLRPAGAPQPQQQEAAPDLGSIAGAFLAEAGAAVAEKVPTSDEVQDMVARQAKRRAEFWSATGTAVYTKGPDILASLPAGGWTFSKKVGRYVGGLFGGKKDGEDR